MGAQVGAVSAKLHAHTTGYLEQHVPWPPSPHHVDDVLEQLPSVPYVVDDVEDHDDHEPWLVAAAAHVDACEPPHFDSVADTPVQNDVDTTPHDDRLRSPPTLVVKDDHEPQILTPDGETTPPLGPLAPHMPLTVRCGWLDASTASTLLDVQYLARFGIAAATCSAHSSSAVESPTFPATHGPWNTTTLPHAVEYDTLPDGVGEHWFTHCEVGDGVGQLVGFGVVVGFAVVGCAVVGVAVVGALVGWDTKKVGAAVVGFAVTGAYVVGAAVVGHGVGGAVVVGAAVVGAAVVGACVVGAALVGVAVVGA